ncbi:MAG TPA: hypothetical protein VFE82_00590 [Ramlibacter sp.]|jgi:hypothetical protein|uniref:hypothetical protein n=1 Tax=Ramlibacter sp. TaxID=1917967 RepID=UPI002D6EC406|nr:hypothetical protein [Ramlibacter sp.]HZY16942.1 hypothetical protein [Ramlibacter sp.]
MQKAPVPDDVRRFILASIPSVPFLEALLLLRANPTQPWGAADTAGRLYIGEAQALDLLQGLEAAGIARRADKERFAYAPASDDLRAVLDGIAAAYSNDLVTVTQMIHSRTGKRAQQFADAFRWKKEGD